jgi:Tol biopolymer transport system component/DNA-binding winged helix-turn-helix (wHTH) protein
VLLPMNNGGLSAEIVRFGPFEADLQTGELRKNGHKVPLQGQPFQVFAILLQHRGKLVTREELRRKVWPEDTFVDFDHGLNTTITKIRTALGDEADNPSFVETMPRRGYRFIGAVIEPGSPAPLPVAPKIRWVTSRWDLFGVGAGCLLLLFGLGFWRFSRKPAEPPLPALEVVPLVAMPGREYLPTFSPDGNQVAFTHVGEPNTVGIYVTLVDGERPLRLTTNAGDSNASWSPDSREIAFVRHSENEITIYVIPALGGAEHKLHTLYYSGESWNCYLGWSPDGKVLAFTESTADLSQLPIALLSLTDLTTRPLTSPPFGTEDWGPAFSPDGSTVAFARTSAPGGLGDLFVIPAKGGETRQITFDNSVMEGLTWTQDGREIVFSSSRAGAQSLWRVSASGGTPRPVQGAGFPAFNPSIPSRGDRLVYQQTSSSDNIWRLDLKNQKKAQGPPVRVTSTNRGFNWRPNFSPDGRKVVFDSNRLGGGFSEIWSCDSDGSNCAQLTSLRGISGTARWSPDGHHIAFESRRQEHEEIYVVEVPGGRPRLVPTFSGAESGAPNWSRDGQWIYFYSDHEGRPFQLWKVPFKGGPPVRVTKNGGIYAIESDDGRFLYYSKAQSTGFTEPGIWKMPVAGGDEVRVVEQPSGGVWSGWALAPDGIYFLNGNPPDGKINFFDFATGKTICIFTVEKPVPYFGGLALSPDGRSLLYSKRESWNSDIMLLKNFR